MSRPILSADEFRELVGNVPTTELCAFFGVTRRTLRRWMSGETPIPFSVYRLAKWRARGHFEEILGREWRDIHHNGRYLFLPGWRAGFTPVELRQLFYDVQELYQVRSENRRLRDDIADARAENTELRTLFLRGRVTDELRAMHDRLGELLSKVGTARIHELPAAVDAEPVLKKASGS